jgi:hypothetical protein
VPFFDIYRFGGRSRDGQRDAGADLKCGVQLEMC